MSKGRELREIRESSQTSRQRRVKQVVVTSERGLFSERSLLRRRANDTCPRADQTEDRAVVPSPARCMEASRCPIEVAVCGLYQPCTRETSVRAVKAMQCG